SLRPRIRGRMRLRLSRPPAPWRAPPGRHGPGPGGLPGDVAAVGALRPGPGAAALAGGHRLQGGARAPPSVLATGDTERSDRPGRRWTGAGRPARSCAGPRAGPARARTTPGEVSLGAGHARSR